MAEPDAYRVTDAERNTLNEAFTRGFSSAYLEGIDDDRMMGYTRPNDRGVKIGRVKAYSARAMTVSLDAALDAEDTIEVWTSAGRSVQQVGPMRSETGEIRTAPAGIDVEIQAEEPVRPGDRVFRVENASLMKAARRTFAEDRQEPRVEVDVFVRAVEGAPVAIEVASGRFHAFATGPEVERARTKALTVDEIVEHVGRMGASPFTPGAWDVEVQPGVGMGFSTLHRVRAEALERLEDEMLEAWAREPRRVDIPALPQASPRTGPVGLAVRVPDESYVQVALAAGADRILIPLTETNTSLFGTAEEIAYEMPRVLFDDEHAALLGLVSSGMRVVAPNLGLLTRARGQGAIVEAHESMNVTNAWAAQVAQQVGAEGVWLSPELRGEQVAAIAKHSDIPTGIAIYGRQQLMVTQHCVLSVGGCSRQCRSCERRVGFYSLTDEKGYAFPVTSDERGRSHVFNSVPLDLRHAVRELLETGVAELRVDITTETVEDVRSLVRSVRQGIDSGEGEAERAEATTTGHFFRGVG
jgi:putative protease